MRISLLYDTMDRFINDLAIAIIHHPRVDYLHILELQNTPVLKRFLEQIVKLQTNVLSRALMSDSCSGIKQEPGHELCPQAVVDWPVQDHPAESLVNDSLMALSEAVLEVRSSEVHLEAGSSSNLDFTSVCAI